MSDEVVVFSWSCVFCYHSLHKYVYGYYDLMRHSHFYFSSCL